MYGQVNPRLYSLVEMIETEIVVTMALVTAIHLRGAGGMGLE